MKYDINLITDEQLDYLLCLSELSIVEQIETHPKAERIRKLIDMLMLERAIYALFVVSEDLQNSESAFRQKILDRFKS